MAQQKAMGLRIVRSWTQHIAPNGTYTPSALWLTGDELAGDASGGVINWDAEPPGAPIVQFAQKLASCEEIMIRNVDAVATARTFSTEFLWGDAWDSDNSNARPWFSSGMTQPEAEGAASLVMRVGLGSQGTGGNSSGWSAFIGDPSGSGRDFQFRVRITTLNNNGTQYGVRTWGYLWDRGLQDRGYIPVRPGPA